MDLSDTIKPKSDQLNADDLIAKPITVTIARVTRADGDQPVALFLQGDYMPYKPCKSMRRVLVAAWGNDGKAWEGRSMTLYCDPEVIFGGVKVGGIRISHLSNIERDLSLMLTTTRSKRKQYTVRKLEVKHWSDADFKAKLPDVISAIDDEKITVDAAIKRLEKTAKLTAEQKSKIKPTPKQDKTPADDGGIFGE